MMTLGREMISELYMVRGVRQDRCTALLTNLLTSSS